MDLSNFESLLQQLESTIFPVSLYKGIFRTLVAVLKLTQEYPNPKTKTSASCCPLNHLVRDLTTNLPGGELLIEEQKDIIQMAWQLMLFLLASLSFTISKCTYQFR
jgi:hypothetical protein